MKIQIKRRVLLASTNQGKLAELAELIGTTNEKIEWVSLKAYPDVGEIAEDGDTFAENARKKALGYAKATGLWTIADDSGLVIDALDGQPGVYSARYATDECGDNRKDIDTANYKKVLAELKDIPDIKRTARFMCCLCLASPEKVLLETEGTFEGIINRGPIGENGFGYDPIFYIPPLNKTAAQLAPQEKNSISHRGNAIRKLKQLLEDLLVSIA
ncbi:MAG: non-canonical purine NTP pyrophosphatase, RdgB/HAM1 family [Planctomycetales bacterium 4572_13]|nr:MAG: non-canonical purine NTP pyrophosphatase, RdgB/HAM1 family [Planctomycetales bacterium 4572_13]